MTSGGAAQQTFTDLHPGVYDLSEAVSDGWGQGAAVCSDGSYGVEPGIMSSFPIRTDGSKWELVQGLPINEFSRGKIDATVAELVEERAAVTELGLI